jgi:hypothetical protein
MACGMLLAVLNFDQFLAVTPPDIFLGLSGGAIPRRRSGTGGVSRRASQIYILVSDFHPTHRWENILPPIRAGCSSPRAEAGGVC